MAKTTKQKKETISSVVTALVMRRLGDDAVLKALKKAFPKLTDPQARAHIAGARRATGRKAPPTAVRTPNVAAAKVA